MYKGIVFDVDGTLANSMHIHFKAYKIALKEVGILVSDEELCNYSGESGRVILENIALSNESEFDIESVYKKKNDIYRKLFHKVTPNSEIIKLIKVFYSKYKLAVASMSSIGNIMLLLSAFKIKDFFDVILGIESIPNGSSKYDIFLKAAEELGLKPEECIVFEDTEKGTCAAKKAGMEFIKVNNGMI